jgi:hypothetical protein
MPDHDALIDGLCAVSGPVRRVSPAWMRAALLIPFMLLLGWFTTTISHHTVTNWSLPDVGFGIANAAMSLLLGVAIFIHALTTSIAGRSVRWRGWVGVALVAWLAITVSYSEGRNCFTFLLVAGLPMAAVVIAALRRTRSLKPVRSLVTGGVSVAFLSFGLLAFCHPAVTTAIDTVGHLAAALVLGALTTIIGLRLVAV